MNKFIYIISLALLVPFSSCKDEDLIPVPAWESAVHGYGVFSANSLKNFTVGDMNTPVSFDLNWVSIDQANTVVKIDLFVSMTEKYTDKDNLVRTISHGSRPLRSLDGAAVPGNRENAKIDITPQQVYDVFKDATYDYGFGDGVVPVFENPQKPDRTPDSRFTVDDSFTFFWAFTTEDGRYFDTWAEDNICGGEFPGANCRVNWGVKN